MTTTAAGFTRYTGTRVPRVEDARLLTAEARTSTTSRGRGCCTRASCAARSPGPDRWRSTSSAALAAPGVRFVFTAADLNPDVQGAVAHVDRPGRARRRRARRWPRTRCASSAIRSCSSWPRAATSPRTPRELVDVDYEPLPAGRRLHDGRATPKARPREPRLQRHRRDRRPARVGARRTCSRRPRTSSSETIHQQAYAAVPMESARHRRRLRSAHRRAHDLRGDAGAARGARCSARACSGCPSTASASSSATPAAASARRSWSSATRCASCSPRRRSARR